MLHMTSVKQINRAACPVDKVGGQTDRRSDGRTRPNSIVPTFFKCWGLKRLTDGRTDRPTSLKLNPFASRGIKNSTCNLSPECTGSLVPTHALKSGRVKPQKQDFNMVWLSWQKFFDLRRSKNGICDCEQFSEAHQAQILGVRKTRTPS